MPDDVHEICRQIAEEILVQWFDEWEGRFPISDDDKEAHLTAMTEILLTKTSVPKMVETLKALLDTEWIVSCSWGSAKDADRRMEIVDDACDFMHALQADKPVEETKG